MLVIEREGVGVQNLGIIYAKLRDSYRVNGTKEIKEGKGIRLKEVRIMPEVILSGDWALVKKR